MKRICQCDLNSLNTYSSFFFFSWMAGTGFYCFFLSSKKHTLLNKSCDVQDRCLNMSHTYMYVCHFGITHGFINVIIVLFVTVCMWMCVGVSIIIIHIFHSNFICDYSYLCTVSLNIFNTHITLLLFWSCVGYCVKCDICVNILEWWRMTIWRHQFST